MNDSLLSAIKAHDFTAIRNICFALSEQERNDLIHTLQTARWEQLYHNTDKRAPRLQSLDIVCFSYIFLCVSRSSDSLKKAVKGCYSSDKDIVAEFLQFYFPPLLDLLTTKEGQYLTTSLQSLRKNQFLQDTTFQNLWTLYQKGFIAFDEDLFIEKFFFWNNKHITDEPFVNFLLENKEISEKIFSIVPQHITQEVPYPSDAWKELYHILQAKGYFADRSIVGSHIEALLNPYKKNILDFYCRIIETFEPTRQELLSHQSTFFALLSSDKTSVVNFVMKLIKEISSEKDFDFQAFADNFTLCFVTQKIAKSQLIGVEILEKYYKKQAPANPDYREQLAVLFTVPDAKLQEKVANLLTIYFNYEGLPEVIAPYRDYLKGKAQNLLQSLPSPNSLENSENSHSSHSSHTFHTSHSSRTPKTARAARTLTPENLLFLLGDCLREPVAHTIDVFLEGLITLQDDFPADWVKSLSPYIKQLTKRIDKGIPTDAILLGVLRALIDRRPLALDPKCSYTWEELCKKRKKLSEKEFEAYTQDYYLGNARQVLPFLFRKGQMVIDFILQHCHLPLLSTPTHLPFYIEAEVLVDKLLQYEVQGVQPDIDDLIVACNRLLFTEVSAAAKEKARQLKGDYAKAIQYYLGLTDEIQLTEELLPLWAQITRLKYPDREFPEFAATSAKDILGVVKPFLIDYGWKENDGYKEFTFGYHTEWVGVSCTDLKNAFPYRYYNANGGSSPISTIFEYKLSLNPHYPDAMLCDYISTWVTGNEVREIRNMSVPLEVLLRYDIRVRHSGWLYIGTALLFEKRPSRDLAYEYICQAITRGEDLTYLKTYLAQALAWNFLPITRFIEFLDRPNPPAVKDFGIAVVKQYLSIVKEDELPKKHKKLANFLIS